MAGRAIGDYALLSDRHSAALVCADGSVDWLCFPRFDSPSVFAALLDDGAGHWSIRPATPATVSRRYRDDSMVLETTFATESGTVVLSDALATGEDAGPHRLGAGAPHLLVREVRCTGGTMELDIEVRPRPDYGLVVPIVEPCDGGYGVRGGPARLALSTPSPLAVDDSGLAGSLSLSDGQTIRFGLHWSPLDGPPPRVWDQAELTAQLAAADTAWRAWARSHGNYDGPWPELVRLSGRVLHALSYQPTGAIVAAPTTSLPEVVRGSRNWDYRYTWLRDSAFTMDALWVAACPDEANEFFDFLTAAAATTTPHHRLQIMYGIGGEHDLSERELPHLAGWRDSRPVRVGNGAWTQTQWDVYGELLATAARFADQLDERDGPFLARLADAAAQRWEQPDHGIWEIRGEARHFLHSKVMCWVALDRAIAIAGRFGAADRVGEWARTREQIRTTVLDQGWNDQVGAYTQSFGSAELDASVLMLPIVGFLPASDPRMLATIDAIAAGLADPRGLIFRYRADSDVDGMAQREGTFLLGTFWLAHALALAGQAARARTVFERAVEHANDVGLLAEQVDPATGELLGNFPQAFSHIGLINAAYAIAESAPVVDPRW